MELQDLGERLLVFIFGKPHQKSLKRLSNLLLRLEPRGQQEAARLICQIRCGAPDVWIYKRLPHAYLIPLLLVYLSSTLYIHYC